MTRDFLRKEFLRLNSFPTINDRNDLIDIYSEFLFLAVLNHQQDEVHSLADSEAKLICQMMLTKTLNIKQIIQGVEYSSRNGSRLNNIIDPTIVASLIRNIYETVGVFNLIYINTKTEDEKSIIYNLWAHSGLKYRQRFTTIYKEEDFDERFNISKEQFIQNIKDNEEKLAKEKEQINQIIEIIESTKLYKTLSQPNQKKIQTRLEKKEYLIKFDHNEVVPLHWQELSNVMNIKEGLFDNLYTYFSLYSHPSNVAVFQFGDMFNIDGLSYLELTETNLKFFFYLTSIFISDYIKLFPKVLKTFESMNVRDQIMINYYNTIIRGYDYSINDSWKAVE